MKGQAADIVIPTVTRYELALWLSVVRVNGTAG